MMMMLVCVGGVACDGVWVLSGVGEMVCVCVCACVCWGMACGDGVGVEGRGL